jgi:hypothetical protein
LTVALVVGLFAPSMALAKIAKASTAFRGLKSSYVIKGAGGGISLTGRLVSRKQIRRNGKKVTVDVPLAGAVSLLRADEPYLPGQIVGRGFAASDSGFSFEVTGTGHYRVRYVGNKRHRGGVHWSEVREDVLGIHNFGGLRASREADGDLFVTVSADFDAPEGLFTTSTPAAAIFIAFSGADGSFGSLLGLSATRLAARSLASTSPVGDPLMGLDNAFIAALRRSGTYRYGFDVPASQADDVMGVAAIFASSHNLVEATSTVTTFTPSALLP